MALARLCVRNARRSSPLLFTAGVTGAGEGVKARSSTPALPPSLPYSSSAPSADAPSAEKGQEVAVSRGSSWAPPRRRGRGRRSGLRWKDPWDLVPFRFTNGLGNALMQVSENLNRFLENWAPSRLLGRMREEDQWYKLRFEVPGLSKEDIRITVDDGYLTITGEHKEEDQGGSDDDDGWYSSRYGYYNTSLWLPEDAKVEEIKAEVKDGILYVTIPRSEEKKKNVREVKIQ